MANFVCMRRRSIPDPLLMLVSIVVITGFQVYWLKNSYDRERHALEIKANSAFQETVRKMQMVRLKLKGTAFDDTSHGKIAVFVDKYIHDTEVKKNLQKQEVVSMVSALKNGLIGKEKDTQHKSDIIFRPNGQKREMDTVTLDINRKLEGGRNQFIQILYKVDSVQDSLKISDIRNEFSKKIAQQNISIPFSILRYDSLNAYNDSDLSTITIGLAHPVTYKLQLGNTFIYIVNKIAVPILFSVFLVGVTIVSFILLYRTLLKQRRLAELKNDFIGNITHELKTPIATVSVAVEALKNFNALQDRERTKEYLDISANELQRLSLLVDKVLKLSMFERKELELKLEPVDLREVVKEVTDSLRLQIEKSRAQVNISATGDTFLEADRLHLLSVVFNLVDNALKYSSGEPVIQIVLAGNDQSVQLSVSDNGIGIAPEYQARIFEKFFRVPAGNTHNAKGYGLGLSYVAQVVEKHRGKISVESKLNKGTRIVIDLPKIKA